MWYCVKLGWCECGLKGEVVVGAKRIRSEKLREDRYTEGYAKSLEGKKIEWDGDDNVKHM